MLTSEEKQHVTRAALLLVRAHVDGGQATFPVQLAELGGRLVGGAFVSLKRGKHLRSCCGTIGKPMPLQQALEHAAYRSALDDVRFPPISPSELDHLDMEVWLLSTPQPVTVKAEERAEAIVIGKHGIQVVRGQASGLFLPSVAVESKWDARRFLDQVCVKAGLPPTAWRDEETWLLTFEGEVLQSTLTDGDSPRQTARPACFCRAEDLPTYTAFCWNNMAALLTGSTPSYYLMGASDGNVSGVVLTLRLPGSSEDIHLSQISLRPGVPLQATLNTLAQGAAQALANQGVRPESFGDIQINLMLLHDVVPQGTVADPHLAGVESRHRAILVLERNKIGLVFDPEHSADEVLGEAVRLAQVSHPSAASVLSLEALSSTSPIRVSTAPRPVAGPAVRPAAMAGFFYEADPAELARSVDTLFASQVAERRQGDKETGRQEEMSVESVFSFSPCLPVSLSAPWSAAMVPHAGLKYSGRIAARVLQRIKIPDTVIVIGPKHTALGMDWAVAPHEAWAVPGGQMAADVDLARQLCRAISGLEMDAAAHQREHAIEVELPLLARLAPRTKVVGIAIGHGDLESCQRFARGLADVLRGRAERPLLLISSDMNHFATDAENRRLDELALAVLDRSDPVELYETVTQNQISMCGVLPAVIVLETLRLLGGDRQAERVGYATTADVTGDTSRVVGYAGMLFK